MLLARWDSCEIASRSRLLQVVDFDGDSRAGQLLL